MADPFIGEIRPFAFSFAPAGWAICAGQILPISQNPALFSIIGTRFGGDGKTTFQLPNLQGRTELGSGPGPGLTPRGVGEVVGSMTATLNSTQLPAHSHAVTVQNGNGTATTPAGHYWGKGVSAGSRPMPVKTYSSLAADGAMAPNLIADTGDGQPHDNAQPCLVVNFCICLQGDFPPRP